MALTEELIKADAALADLTPEAIKAIETLSTNDEAAVINTKIGEHHGLVEADVLEVSGIKKNDGEKSYDYMKRAIGDFKTKSEASAGLETKITDLNSKITDYEKQIKEGNTDKALAQKLSDAEGQVVQMTAQHKTEKEAWDEEKTGYTTKISDIQIGAAFTKATAAMKFKPEYPETVQKTLLDNAKATVLAKNKIDWIDGGTAGVKEMVFRNAEGEIMRNKTNSLNPYTAAELIGEELKEVLDLGKKQPGGGSKKTGAGGSGNVETVDIASAKTQVEADELIVKFLMQDGETRGTQSFSDRQKKIRTDNKVGDLPMRTQ